MLFFSNSIYLILKKYQIKRNFNVTQRYRKIFNSFLKASDRFFALSVLTFPFALNDKSNLLHRLNFLILIKIKFLFIRLPAPSLPEFSMFFDVIQDAIIIALVAFASSISVADTFARKHNYKIDSNKVMRLKHFYPLRATNK